ncbi:30S ribosomal protein S18 [Mycolicibacterium madagascariense]|uniref:Small ribosomal subunit protein bS18 n=1 Tax=Mycolicibacterium madagascariense TaxID=212765 RepID=A0A7I7XB65_9MYCO|nr:30S ribosomal protein S18 [Mycolicibacterium madagascariense]MCV7014980.1 30S ribosomal protein S18 [Mycolicibacterium madagascariense]BBZ26896.1 30S ribosomal protein S18 [Mycolicibacterium madagascariense]
MAHRKKSTARRPSATEPTRTKANPLTAEGIEHVDWKDVALLRTFVSDRGKIRSRRVTGLTVQQQRRVATAVKNARDMALLPYTSAYPTPPR